MQYGIPRPTGFRLFAVAASIVAVATAVACSADSTSPGNGASSQLAFMATGLTRANASTVPVTVGSHTLDLTSVSLTVVRAELKRTSTDACTGDDDGEGDEHPHGNNGNNGTSMCGELKVGPTTVDLSVAGNVVTVPANTIPAGTYRELELRVSKAEIKGTFDGKPFDVTLNVNAKSEIEFATPLVVKDSTPVAITVTVPTATWLRNADGSLIDPSTLAASPALMAQVQNQIRASLRAFEDRDHDGRDDHER